MPYWRTRYVPMSLSTCNTPSEACTCHEGLVSMSESLSRHVWASLAFQGPLLASLTCLSPPCNAPRSQGHVSRHV